LRFNWIEDRVYAINKKEKLSLLESVMMMVVEGVR
jgi:hypothetical protein